MPACQEASWMHNILLASFAWLRLFILQAFAPFPPALPAVLQPRCLWNNCTHDLWMRGKLRWKCFWSCTSGERDKIFEVWWGGKGCAQKRVWCTAPQLRCSCMPESSLGGENKWWLKAASSDSFVFHLPHRYFSCQEEVNLIKDLLCFPEQ